MALLVDHPDRDLDGMVLVAAHLASLGFSAAVVPMYERHEVLFLRPRLVLVNYLRYATLTFVRQCRSLGIRVAVHDTEGGLRADMPAFVAAMREALCEVDLYCAWGSHQAALVEQVGGCTVALTGPPRYDFAAQPWRDALPDMRRANREFVIVNTNFAIANPRFDSVASEVAEVQRVLGQDCDVVMERLAQTRVAFEMIIDATQALAQAFPEIDVVLRAHPFESDVPYRHRLERFTNVRLERTGSVIPWLASAKALVHHNCSTAVEATLVGCPSIHVEWEPLPRLAVVSSSIFSSAARTKNELIASMTAVLRSAEPPPAEASPSVRDEAIRQFYFRQDGRCAERVAQAIVAELSKPLPHDLGLSSSVGLTFGQQVARFAGPWAYRTARTVAGRSRVGARDKRFSRHRVDSILDCLRSAHAAWGSVGSYRRLGFRSIQVTTARQHVL